MAEEMLIQPKSAGCPRENDRLRKGLTVSLLAVTFLSSLGSSMLYGYNLAVVNSPANYIKDFYNSTIVSRNHTGVSRDTLMLLYSVTVSVFAVGGLLGSLLVRMLVTKFGRKRTLVNSSMLVFTGGTLMGFSRICQSPEMVIIGRFITGIHSGISLSVVPMYLGEIAPKNVRGFLGLIPSIFICVGVFIAQILGLHEILGKDEHWPLLLSLVIVPTFLQLMLLPWFPESPRYLLIERHNIHATIAALRWYRAKGSIQAEIEEMQEEQRSLSAADTVSVRRLLADEAVRWQVLSVAMVSVGMQLSGIDAIWFYTNAIFENAGIPVPQIQYTTVATGAIEVISGLIGCFTVERVGRRVLMIGGFSFMGLCCAGITVSLVLQAHVSFMRYVSVACVVGIIAGFCIGPAGVPFLMTAELFKQSHRPAAYTVGGALNWTSNFTVGFIFPFLQLTLGAFSRTVGEYQLTWSDSAVICVLVIVFCLYGQMSAGAFCYLVFCGICTVVAAYVYFVIPETKNKTFMEISQMFNPKRAIPESQALGDKNQFKLKAMYDYGSLENQGDLSV